MHALLCNSVTFIDQLYRHGDRSPISEYPSDKVPLTFWYEGLGQLSRVSSPYPLRVLALYNRTRSDQADAKLALWCVFVFCVFQ